MKTHLNELALQHPIDSALRELALFAGAGGGILGGKLLGWRTVCAVEWDAYARDVLVARQNDGCLEAFPIWDDVQTFDGKPWRGRVDVVSGGFPCQDISCAGKGAGIEGERSGMWKHMARIIGEVLPQFVFVENSPMLVGRGLAVVLADLAEMGYDAEWGIVGVHNVSAPHKRERIWIVANADSIDRRTGTGRKDGKKIRHASGNVANAAGAQDHAKRGDCECGRDSMGRNQEASQQDERTPDHDGSGGCGGDVSNAGGERGQLSAEGQLTAIEQPWSDSEARSSGGIAGEWWATEPDVGRVAHGVAPRVDRLRCIGNGQVPAVAALAWNLLNQKQ